MNHPASIPPAWADPVLIYDADCGFCLWSLAMARRALPLMPPVEPFQTADLARYGITRRQAMAAVQLVVGHRRLGGYRAVAGVLLLQPRWWLRWAGALITIPPMSFVADIAYRWIARHRQLLPGHTDACALPGSSEAV